MNIVRLVAIVSGHGEVESVPILVRRIAAENDPSTIIIFTEIFRIPEGKLRKPGELERAVEYAARKIVGSGGILILIDCDWNRGCPKTDAPELLSRARSTRPDIPISVILAYKEFEAWFIAAAESLRRQRGLSKTMNPADDPESIRGAKEWLSRHMPPNRPYSERIDQPALTALFDMNAAKRTTNSFDKCYREISGLVNRLLSDSGQD
jgi:hypothetical protein